MSEPQRNEPTVLSMVLTAVEDLKSSMVRFQTDITVKIDSLDQKFLPRAEYEARHSDLRNTVTRLDARVDAEVTAREALEDRLVQGHRWAIGAALTGGLLVIGLLTLILTTAGR